MEYFIYYKNDIEIHEYTLKDAIESYYGYLIQMACMGNFSNVRLCVFDEDIEDIELDLVVVNDDALYLMELSKVDYFYGNDERPEVIDWKDIDKRHDLDLNTLSFEV